MEAQQEAARPNQSSSKYAVGHPTKKHPELPRQDLNEFLAKGRFGHRLTGCSSRAKHSGVFDRVADIAREHGPKETNVQSYVWSIKGTEWLKCPVNMQPLEDRVRFFRCSADVYDYKDAPPNTLIVDFANRHVGGGCFSGGFVQEEQMVMQSTDFAIRLHMNRELIGVKEAVAYTGAYMDAWWPRSQAALKDALDISAIESCPRGPFNILAVDAPVMRPKMAEYCPKSLAMLARKILLIYEVASALDCPMIFSGLLGGGAFRNNRPLVLLLHMLLQPREGQPEVVFHYPIFWSFCRRSIPDLEESVVSLAGDLMEKLRAQGVRTLDEALQLLLDWGLSTSQNDDDLNIPVPMKTGHSKRNGDGRSGLAKEQEPSAAFEAASLAEEEDVTFPVSV